MRRVSYPKTEWSRSAAWDHLHEQQIPGCPKLQATDGTWVHGWCKSHTADAWSWFYEGRRSVTFGSPLADTRETPDETSKPTSEGS